MHDDWPRKGIVVDGTTEDRARNTRLQVLLITRVAPVDPFASHVEQQREKARRTPVGVQQAFDGI